MPTRILSSLAPPHEFYSCGTFIFCFSLRSCASHEALNKGLLRFAPCHSCSFAIVQCPRWNEHSCIFLRHHNPLNLLLNGFRALINEPPRSLTSFFGPSIPVPRVYGLERFLPLNNFLLPFSKSGTPNLKGNAITGGGCVVTPPIELDEQELEELELELDKLDNELNEEELLEPDRLDELSEDIELVELNELSDDNELNEEELELVEESDEREDMELMDDLLPDEMLDSDAPNGT